MILLQWVAWYQSCRNLAHLAVKEGRGKWLENIRVCAHFCARIFATGPKVAQARKCNLLIILKHLLIYLDRVFFQFIDSNCIKLKFGIII